MTASLADDLSGPFDPAFSLADFSRQALADLGREWLLNGHLQDRVGLPTRDGPRRRRGAWRDVSIEEWMAASPIYSKRMQRALHFEGNDVATIFKNLQLDIGAPHQFMDVPLRPRRPELRRVLARALRRAHGRRALRRGRVRQMCHDIEDPDLRRDRRRDPPVREDAADPPAAARARPTAYPHCRW